MKNTKKINTIFRERLNLEKFNTISFKITFISLSATLLATFITGAILLNRVSNMVSKENQTHLDHALQNITSIIDSAVRETSQSNRTILNNAGIQEILIRSQKENYSNEEYINDRDQISLLMTGLTVSEGVYFASFYGKDGFAIFNTNSFYIPIDFNLFRDSWILDHQQQIDDRDLFIIPPKRLEQNYYSSFWPYLIVRPLKDMISKDVIAYVAVFGDCRVFQNILQENYNQLVAGESQSLISDLHLLDSENYVIASTNKEEIGIQFSLENQNEKPRYNLTSQYSEFTTVLTANPNYFAYTIRSTMLPLIIMLFFLFTIFGIIIVTALRIKMRPLQKLTISMAQVGQGDFTLTLDEKNINETDIREVYRGFNRMTKKINSLIINDYQQQILLKSAQIESLKYQINPHFLYNTLQAIEAIAEIRNIPDIQVISVCLSKMFRYNLAAGDIVTLSEELSHLSSYFKIEKIRFQDCIHFEIKIDKDLHGQKIPKFILQPIVENAIIHGFSGITAPRIIQITADTSEEKQQLILHVIDNGIGITEEKLRELNQQIILKISPSQSSQIKESIGIANVHKRVVNYCGDKFGVHIHSIPDQGTDVSIYLPLSFDYKL